MTTPEKCEAIVRAIVKTANSGETLSFSEDWGGNSLTVGLSGSHTHVGLDDLPWEDFVGQLHGLLCEGRGLSWG